MLGDDVLLAAASLTLAVFTAYLFINNRRVPGKAPPLVKGELPFTGPLKYWTKRWEFFQEAARYSSTGQFSFHVGQHHVVGVTGDEARKVFLESKDFNMSAGYAALFAGGAEPPAKSQEEQDLTSAVFSKRVTEMLKRENFVKTLGRLISDTRSRLDELAKDLKGLTGPFESVYGIVYQLTMRTVACNDIANDRVLLERTLDLFEQIDAALSPHLIIYPWLPSLGKMKRLWAAANST